MKNYKREIKDGIEIISQNIKGKWYKIKETHPSGNVYEYRYNKRGKKTRETYPNGDIITYEPEATYYDKLEDIK